MSKSNIERRIEVLEAREGVGGSLCIMRIIFDPGLMAVDDIYREIRYLMVDDGSEKGHYIRTLEPGEVVLGVENPKWLKMSDPDEEA